MVRWEPDARARLERAGLELFSEQGFDATTVPQITARAGLTTRTFFRHFADKREVLFGEQSDLTAFATSLVDEAPEDWGPAEVVIRRLPDYVARAFGERRDLLRERKMIIDGHEGLRERELRKMAALVDAISGAFRARGVDALTAALVAETSTCVVRISLSRWLHESDRDLAAIVDESLQSLVRAWTVRQDAAPSSP